MTKSVDLHPEDLIDRLAAGELTDSERERLRSHLSMCAACRLEVGVRYALEDDDSPASVDGSELALAPGSRAARGVATPLKVRPAPRRPLVLLSVAAVLCTGGALAAVLSGAVRTLPWARWSPETHVSDGDSDSSRPNVTANSKRRKAGAGNATTSVVAPTGSEAAPVGELDAVVAPPVSTPHVEPEARSAPVKPRAAVAETEPKEPRRAAGIPAATSFPDPEPAQRAGVADAPPPAVESVNPARLFSDANRARRDGDTARALDLYRTLESQFPNAAESRLSRAFVAKLLLDRGDPEDALAAFDGYLAQDSAALNAEALVGRARALEQLGRRDEAVASWKEVLRRFPGSIHARLASTRLSALDAR